MKTIYKTIGRQQQRFELKIQNNFWERLRGVHQFAFLPESCILLFRTPCLLHTFGLRQSLWLQIFDSQFSPLGNPIEFPPNTIAYACQKNAWAGEMTHCKHSDSQEKHNSLFLLHIPKILNLSLQKLLLLKSFLTWCFFALFLFQPCTAWAASGPLKLPVGESKEVTLDEPPRSIDISQPDVIDVQRIGGTNKILVTALRSGQAKLTVHFAGGEKKQWNFQVGITTSAMNEAPSLSAGSLVRFAREIQKRAGLETIVDNGRIVIFGNLQNELQFKALIEICLGRDDCMPRYSASDEIIKSQAKFFRALFRDYGFMSVTVEPSLGGILVKGSVDSQENLEKIRLLLRATLSKFHDSLLIEKSGDTLIETELNFFRMNLSQLDAFGLSTDHKSEKSSTDLVRAEIPTLLAQLKNGPKIQLNFPDIVMNALSQKGILQQLAKPSIVIASGSRGEIQTGGELLFQSKGQHQKFFVQNYGLSVVLSPKLSGSGRILQKVEIKLSNPQPNPNPQSLSSLDQSLLNTEVNYTPDEQILLTRIFEQVEGKAVSKIPILGHLPIIGELFKNRQLTSHDSELWITLKSRLNTSPPPQLPSTQSKLNFEKPSAHWLD